MASQPIQDSGHRKAASLLTLPAELRMNIYEYVFALPSWHAHREKCDINRRYFRCLHCRQCSILNSIANPPRYLPMRILIDQTGVQRHPSSGVRKPPTWGEGCFPEYHRIIREWPEERTAILRTCKAIYAEAKDALYNETLFIVEIRVSSAFEINDCNRLDKVWLDRIPVVRASFLRHIHHLDLTLRLRKPMDLNIMTNFLPQVSERFAPSDQFKSISTFVSSTNIARPALETQTTPEWWTYFAQQVAALPMGTQLRWTSWPRWLKQSNTEYQELDDYIRGRLLLKDLDRSLGPKQFVFYCQECFQVNCSFPFPVDEPGHR